MAIEPTIPAAPADTASHSPMHPRHEQTFPVFDARVSNSFSPSL